MKLNISKKTQIIKTYWRNIEIDDDEVKDLTPKELDEYLEDNGYYDSLTDIDNYDKVVVDCSEEYDIDDSQEFDYL